MAAEQGLPYLASLGACGEQVEEILQQRPTRLRVGAGPVFGIRLLHGGAGLRKQCTKTSRSDLGKVRKRLAKAGHFALHQ